MTLSEYITAQLGTDDWAMIADTRGPAAYPASTRLVTVAESDRLAAAYISQGGTLPDAHRRLIASATKMRAGKTAPADQRDLPGTYRHLLRLGPYLRLSFLHGECLIGRGHWTHPVAGSHEPHQINYMGVTARGHDDHSTIHNWMFAAGHQARAMTRTRRENARAAA